MSVLLDIPKAGRSSISLTPLIDVVFILLLFFMLSSTFNQTKQMELHSAVGNAATAERDALVHLLLETELKVSVDGEYFYLEQEAFTQKLQQLNQQESRVLVAARSEVPVQQLVSLLGLLNAAGLQNFNLSESVTAR